MKKLLYLKDHELKEYIEKIFTGYRETVSDAKKVLDKYSIGVAHNKVIHLISLYDGITISELLKRLKVTKQSLNRVLKDLIKLKAINYKKDKKDTRIKHVFLTEFGVKLFDEIFNIQKKRFYKAFLNSDSKEVLSFEKVLKKIINEKI
jgi:DNA-binding MarR family transcriptional regulator